MKIVIDIGAAPYGGDYSIERLIGEFHPDLLYAFDPNPALTEKPPGECEGTIIQETAVFKERLAAWTYRGQIGFLSDGLNSCLTDRTDVETVECFDLADFIRRRPDDAEVILKLDCEGSEYELLEHLMANGVDERLSLLWVEWHPFGVPDPDERRASIERRLRCSVDEWRW